MVKIVYKKISADLETPVSVFLKLYNQGEPAFLLESVQGGESRGRYSIIGLNPDKILKVNGDSFSLTNFDNFGRQNIEFGEGALQRIRDLISECKVDIPKSLPPVITGLFGYFGYEMSGLIEKLPESKKAAIGMPDSILMRPRDVIVFDSVADEIIISTLTDDSEAIKEANTRLERLEGLICRELVGHRALGLEEDLPLLDVKPETSRENFLQMVEKAQEYIAAGDIFQVVLSTRFVSDFYLPPFSLYRALRHLNPSPFLFYLDLGDFSMVGSSPEIMVRLRNGKITIRPIAGTRKRGETAAEDEALAEDMLNDPKELAEHLMLLDLGRNDVGRAAKPNSVKVTEKMHIEHYSHVMHLVSNVEGELADDKDQMDALFAGFPAGTLTGAPKIRAQEIIHELENHKREYYGGAVGYFGVDGNLDTCIAIRTGIVKDNRLYVQAGAGIVADSIPQNEYDECINKAKAVLRAATIAQKFL